MHSQQYTVHKDDRRSRPENFSKFSVEFLPGMREFPLRKERGGSVLGSASPPPPLRDRLKRGHGGPRTFSAPKSAAASRNQLAAAGLMQRLEHPACSIHPSRVGITSTDDAEQPLYVGGDRCRGSQVNAPIHGPGRAVSAPRRSHSAGSTTSCSAIASQSETDRRATLTRCESDCSSPMA